MSGIPSRSAPDMLRRAPVDVDPGGPLSAHALVESVTAGPRTDVVVTEAVTDRRLRVTTYRGGVRIGRRTVGLTALRPTELLPVAFFLPDSLAYPRPPDAVDLQLAISYFYAGGELAKPQGAVDARAAAVADPRGGPDGWLQVTFAVPATTEAVEFAYVVTVVSAAP